MLCGMWGPLSSRHTRDFAQQFPKERKKTTNADLQQKSTYTTYIGVWLQESNSEFQRIRRGARE
eukprot:855574-Amphidinium_carterae.1